MNRGNPPVMYKTKSQHTGNCSFCENDATHNHYQQLNQGFYTCTLCYNTIPPVLKYDYKNHEDLFQQLEQGIVVRYDPCSYDPPTTIQYHRTEPEFKTK